MKSILKIVTLASVMALAVACGKNQSGGSGSKNSNLSKYANNLDTGSVQAVQAFNAWYNNNTEGFTPQNFGLIGVDRSTVQKSTNNGCQEHELFGFIPVTTCFQSSNSSNGTISSCAVTMNLGASRVKHLNPTLKKIAETPTQIGTLEAGKVSGSVIYLAFRKANNHLVVYTIDTALHSSFQPVQKEDSETNQIVYFKCFRNNANGLSSCTTL